MLASLTGAPSDITVELPAAGAYMVRAVQLGSSLDGDGRQSEAWRLLVWPSAD